MNPIVSAGAIKVKVTEPSEVYEQATEKRRRWNETEVELVTDGDKSFCAMCDPTGVAPVLGIPADATVKEVRVRRRGPCATPISWVVKAQPPAADYRPGAEVPVEISARVRHSVWTNGSAMFDDKGTLRTDVISDLQGQVDDISMLETFFLKSSGPDCEFDERFAAPRGKEAAKKAACEEIITACHGAGIQVLCGYEGVGTLGTNTPAANRFRDFLLTASIEKIEKHAVRIYEKIFVELGLDFDGVGFDLEVLGIGELDEQVEALFGTLARKLAADNRILTYASATFAVDGKTSEETKHLRSQKYKLAKLAPNIIVRPMGYDGGQVYNENTKVGLHKDGIDCALRDVGLHPSQFQMGVKIVNKLGGNQVGNSTAWTGDIVRKRIDDLYRPNRIGLISFALGGLTEPTNGQMRDAIKTFDGRLNPNGPKPGAVGTPLQCPRVTANGR